jgi:hypothetical protein
MKFIINQEGFVSVGGGTQSIKNKVLTYFVHCPTQYEK